MSARKIHVSLHPPANLYSAPNERIVEYSSPNGGGLISFRLVDGHLRVELYRHDDTVLIVSPDTVLPSAGRDRTSPGRGERGTA